MTATPTTRRPGTGRGSLLRRPSREAGLNVVILTMAVACGLTVANLYYPQPLLALVAHGFGVSQGTAAIVVTVTQLGYAAGLAFLVPLGDMLENRKLACRTLLVTAAALAVAAFTPDFTLFLVVSVFIGVTSVVVQILVPFAAHLAPPAQRGKYVGRVMSGLLLGILLARSVASVTAAAWGWRSIYIISAVAMLALSAVLWRVLPVRLPEPGVRYGGLLRSALRLVATEPVLRRRSASQALMFGAFSAFWTSIAYELIDAHHLSQLQIALFALVGAAGAVAAVVAGALGDRGYGRARPRAVDRARGGRARPGRARPGQRYPAGVRRRAAGSRRAEPPGAQPAGHLRAPRGRPRPYQHRVHDLGVRGRLDRLRAVGLAARRVRVDRRDGVRHHPAPAGRRHLDL